ncbi:penicillin acylase family protein, partial [Pseudomonas aeruginosa]|nr:penicillin acylase family protein [Pseudomonas aeruginosa]
LDAEGSAARLACASPHRAGRATALLDSVLAEHGSIRHEYLLAAQLDTAAPHWPRLLRSLFVELVRSTEGTSAGDSAVASPAAGSPGAARPGAPGRRLSHTASWVRARLLAWDGDMAAGSTTASWFAVWR